MNKDLLMYTLPLQAYLSKKSVYPEEDVEIKVHLPQAPNEIISNQNLSENLLQNGDFTNGLTNWTSNQNVSLEVIDQKLVVTSSQNTTSTPGIVYTISIQVTPLEEMYLIYRGNVSRTGLVACPFIRGLKDSDPSFRQTIVWAYDQYLANIMNHASISNLYLRATEELRTVVFRIPEEVDRISLYFLFNGPEIGDQFILDAISLYHIIGNVPFNPNNLILNNDFSQGLIFWGKNGSVSLEIDTEGKLLITNPQKIGTPGIRYVNPIDVIPGGKYLLSYRAYRDNLSYTVCPLVTGYNDAQKTGHIIWAYSGYLENITNLTDITELYLTETTIERNIEFIIPEGTNRVYIYFLYVDPSVPVSWVRLEYVNLFLVDTESSTENPEGKVNICIIDKKKQTISKFLDISAKQQKYVKNAFAIGCDWDTTLVYNIPANLQPDLYYVEIMDKYCNMFYLDFIVKNPTHAGDILVLSNINTHNAYNDWAGLDGEASLYKWAIETDDGLQYKSSTYNTSNYVSFERPDLTNSREIRMYNSMVEEPFWSHQIIGEVFLFQWMDQNNIEYDLINDQDLHQDGTVLLNYKIFIIHCHPEYWSKEMMIALNQFRDSGGKIMYLGGNGLYWRVSYDNANNHIMETRKDASIHSQDGLQGGLWKDRGAIIEPYDTTPKLLNCYYVFISSDEDIFGAPYKILQPTHWIFSGIQATLVGLKSLNSPKIKFEENKTGASGHEMDQDILGIYGENIIAKGDNPNNTGADMLYVEKNGGHVFSIGSISYTGSLLIDEDLSKLTKNVIYYMLLPDIFFEKYTLAEIQEILIKLQ